MTTSNLPAEHLAQWTEEVRIHYGKLRKAREHWQKTNNTPSDVLGCFKDDGMLTPLFIPNEPYLRYQELQREWVIKYEPAYIKDTRARMSAGDFGEEDDWSMEK